tara:strand:+ start:15620 stop:16108 length:489 start_codon:yes stop_codon:yes gene_type:complete
MKTAYLKGIESEDKVIKHFFLTPSSKEDNIKRDIDAWEIRQKGKVPISIKTQHKAAETGNLSFETTLINHLDPDDTMPSWFLTGEADEYWIVVEDKVYVFDTQVLKSFVLENSWMFKTTRLTNKKLIEENIKAGRKYCQSSSILVSLSGLIQKGLVEKILEL